MIPENSQSRPACPSLSEVEVGMGLGENCDSRDNGLKQVQPLGVAALPRSFGRLVKLADTQDLGSCAERCRGSSPRAATSIEIAVR